MTAREPSGSPEGEFDGFLLRLGTGVDPVLLQTALTHRSWAAEHADAEHNERLEFLGDSVLGLVVTSRLYRDFPNLSEGELSKRRAAIVSESALAGIARDIGLGDVVRLGRGERRSGGRGKDSILADTMEAVIGAVYLSAGGDAADSFVARLTAPLFERLEELVMFFDPKTTLHEEAQARQIPTPTYTVTSAGPDHDRVYTATVKLEGVTGEGSASNKKSAEILAARQVVDELRKSGRLLTVNDA